jgi:hypothetical protein
MDSHELEPPADFLDFKREQGDIIRRPGSDVRGEEARRFGHVANLTADVVALIAQHVGDLPELVIAAHLCSPRDQTFDALSTNQRLKRLERRSDDHSTVSPECEAFLCNGVKGLALSLAADLCDPLGALDRLMQVPAFAAKLDGRHFLSSPVAMPEAVLAPAVGLCRRLTFSPAMHRVDQLHTKAAPQNS